MNTGEGRVLKEERKGPMWVYAGREKSQCKGPEAGIQGLGVRNQISPCGWRGVS